MAVSTDGSKQKNGRALSWSRSASTRQGLSVSLASRFTQITAVAFVTGASFLASLAGGPALVWQLSPNSVRSV